MWNTKKYLKRQLILFYRKRLLIQYLLYIFFILVTFKLFLGFFSLSFRQDQFQFSSIPFFSFPKKQLTMAELISKKCFMDPTQDTKYRSMNSIDIVNAIESECELNPPENDCHIPKVVHFVLGKYFRFEHYVTVKSAYDRLQPLMIYLHLDLSIAPLKDEILLNAISDFEMTIVQYRNASKVYDIPVLLNEHMGDVNRMEILLRYGGIYLDLDAIVLQPFDPLLYVYNAYIAAESDYGLNNGIMVARRCSSFFLAWYR